MLKVLRHFKFLRHSFLDIFNATAHRKREWALLADYETTLDELLGDLSTANRQLAVQIASIPEHVRGFDTVKDAQVQAAKEKEAELLDAFRRA